MSSPYVKVQGCSAFGGDAWVLHFDPARAHAVGFSKGERVASLIDDILSALGQVARHHDAWNVAVTSDPERRHRECGAPAVWHQWDAKHASVASLLEEYLRARGMRIVGAKETGATHICVFKREGGEEAAEKRQDSGRATSDLPDATAFSR